MDPLTNRCVTTGNRIETGIEHRFDFTREEKKNPCIIHERAMKKQTEYVKWTCKANAMKFLYFCKYCSDFPFTLNSLLN